MTGKLSPPPPARGSGRLPVITDVLIIDDSEIARAAMSRALTAAGLSVEELESPIGATAAILRGSIRLVVVDVNMPSMCGDKLAVLLRKHGRFPGLRIVLVSGEGAKRLEELAREVRADAVVAKSAGHGELVRVVTRLLERTSERPR